MSPHAAARSIYYPPKTFFHHHHHRALRPRITFIHPLSPPYHPGYRLHNHLPPLPSEYAAGLIQPVLLRDPSSIYTREKVAGICPLLSSCPLAQCTAHSGTVIVHRWLIRILHSWVGRFPANGNRISSDHENGRNVADKMQTIYFWNNPEISIEILTRL